MSASVDYIIKRIKYNLAKLTNKMDEFFKILQVKVRILNLRRVQNEKRKNLGARVYYVMAVEKMKNPGDDHTVSELVVELGDLETKLDELNAKIKEIKQIKMEERRERAQVRKMEEGQQERAQVKKIAMTERNNIKNGAKFSPAIFFLILIFFFLPFIHISCEGLKVASFTGIQLVTGTNIEMPSMPGEKPEVEKVPGEPLAILAFFCVVLGLALSFLKSKKSKIAPAITRVVGLIFLLLLKVKIDNDVLREGKGMLKIEYGIGFWVTFLLFIIAAGWNSFLFSKRKKANQII